MEAGRQGGREGEWEQSTRLVSSMSLKLNLDADR